MGTERQPRKNETIVINADGERRIVPKTFLKNRKVMNQFGWREDTGAKVYLPESKPQPPIKTEPSGKETDGFQDVTCGEVTNEASVEIKQPIKNAGRPAKK